MNVKLNFLSSLLIVILFAWGQSLSAQCVPDSTLGPSGIAPDTLIGTCVGIPYEATVTINVPLDTMVQGITAQIDSLVLDSVAGLPPGLNFICLDGSCAIEGGGSSCLLISGTPTTAGDFPVDIYITGYVKFLNNPIIQLDTLFSFYTILVNPEFETTINVTSATCGASDGTASVTATGAPPYTYLWSTGETTASVSGLAAGIYTVTSTNSNGCEITNTVEVPNTGNVPVISVDNAGWTGCSEDGGGTINISVSGGMGAYTYNWSNGASMEDLDGLAGGNYSVEVSDANGCKDTEIFDIVQPAVMNVTILSQSNLACFGDNSGAITAVLGGGMAPYTTTWDTNPQETGLSIDNLSAGTYTLSVTDDLGCAKTASATLTEPAEIVVSVADTSETAVGAMNGSATAEVTGGNGPYTYSWDNGDSTARIDSLVTGTYVLTVTDASNCTKMVSVDVGQWAVGIEDELAAGISAFSVFPNPNQGMFDLNVSLLNIKPLTLTLYDIQGQRIYVDQMNPGIRFEKSLDLSMTAKGVYFLQIKTDKGQATRRLFIY